LVCAVRKQHWYQATNLSQVDIPHLGLDAQSFELHVHQRRRRESVDDIEARHRALKTIELASTNNDNGILSVKRYPLRAALLRLPDNFAKAGFGVLKPPSPGA
jgi:hypothetical protein